MKVVIATTNKSYDDMLQNNLENLEIRHYSGEIDFKELLSAYDGVTIQSGGELNSMLLTAGLIDSVRIVIAPIIILGAATYQLYRMVKI